MAARTEGPHEPGLGNEAQTSSTALNAGIEDTKLTPSNAGADPFIGRVLSHYRLDEPLGAGGMGVLYRATDLQLGRTVAIKILSRDLAKDTPAKARFIQEARAASALDHPNIATIYEIGEQDGELFIAMALYQGQTLQQRLEKGPLPIEDAIKVLKQVALGLGAAHRTGIVHRDIKPANVFVTADDLVKILDFGIAKLTADGTGPGMTQTGQTVGTVAYMSPEQLRGQAVDQRSDLWSLGVLVYELLCGVAPFQADSSASTAMRILNDEPPSLGAVPGVPDWLAKLVSQLLRKNPEERPQTATDVLRSLDAGPTEPMRRWSPRQWFSELKGRRVLRVLVGYGLVAFLVLQISQPLIRALQLAETTLTYVVLALALGFPVAVVLAWAFDVRSDGVRRYARAAPGTSGLQGARLILILVGIGVLAAAPGLGWYFLLRGGARTSRPADGERGGAAERSSIAVLPFANMSADKESEYFSDGMTEELINALANVDGLQVASRTSAFAFKGKNLSIQKIGQELNVGTVVEGSVRREGDRLRIAAQLVNVADGYHLWSKTYERELKNIFAVEDELARSIVQALKPKLMGSESAPLVKSPTSSLEAHDLYLQGRYFKEKRSAEALRTAAGFFAQATEKDPAYALAWVGLADATALLPQYSEDVPASSVLPKARQSGLRALELDPRLAEAQATLGMIALFSFQWAEAEAAYRKAIELNPRYPTAHHWYALLLDWQGRISEGYAETDRAYRLDPTSPIINNLVGVTRVFARDLDGAVEAFKRTLEMAPDFGPSRSGLGAAYAAQGKYTEALAEYDHVSGFRGWARGLTYVLAGRRADARRLVEEMEQRAKREYVSPAERGVIWVALGEKDRGYALLAKACAEADWRLLIAKVHPLFDGLRTEPRFHEVLKCIHLE